jgi:hypothetical protein
VFTENNGLKTVYKNDSVRAWFPSFANSGTDCYQGEEIF